MKHLRLIFLLLLAAGAARAQTNVGGGGDSAFQSGSGPSYQDAGGISTPSNPASGSARLFFNSGTNLFNCITSSGANCFPAGGSGTVTQVTSGNFSPLFNVSVATNTTTPAFSFAAISQSQNLFFASPNGSSGNPSFRAMVAVDIPAGGSCAANQFMNAIAAALGATCAQPAFSNLSGGIAIGQTPLTTRGDLLTVDATPALIRLALGTNGQCLTSNGTDALWGSCAAGSGVTLQTNTVNNTSQTTLNLLNSAATNGLTLTHTNTSAGNVQLGLSGVLTVPGGGTGLATLTAHNLYVGNGTGNPNPVSVGNAGQVLESNGGSADPTFQDPIVSYSYVNLFNAISATGTQTSSTVRVSTFGQYGELIVTWASITGSPSGCTIQFKSADSLGNLTNNGSAVAVAPANGTSAILFTPSIYTASQIQAVYACATTYPSAGTLSLDFVPSITTFSAQGPPNSNANGWPVALTDLTNIIGTSTHPIRNDPTGTTTQPVSGTVTANAGTGQFNVTCTAANCPINTAQFGGTNVVTGTGASGSGIPRVTIANDSSLAANQSVNVNQVAGSTLGALANYGTSPGAVLVESVNANVTNTPNVNIQANAGVNLAQENGTAITNTPTAIGTLGSGNVISTNGDLTSEHGTAITNVPTAIGTKGTGNVMSVNADLTSVAGTATSTAAAGVQKVGIVGNTGVAIDAATGAAPPANALLQAGLGSGATGGFLVGVPVGDTYKAINISTATTTLIVTGVSGRQVRIGAQHMIAAAADNVAWIEGTGATCGTGTAGMAGGTTAASGYNFAANGGIADGSGLGTVLQTVTAGDSVCLVTSAAVQLSGGIEYTIY
jgi:hypothetical protein